MRKHFCHDIIFLLKMFVNIKLFTKINRLISTHITRQSLIKTQFELYSIHDHSYYGDTKRKKKSLTLFRHLEMEIVYTRKFHFVTFEINNL